VGVARGGTALPQPPDPPPHPSPSRNRVYAGFGHSIKRSKSATADFDRGEGVAAARIALARRRENGAPATVTRRDDLWRLDRHRILCTDPHDLTTIDRMLGGERLVFVTFEPELCDQIVRHFRQLTGQDATLAASGQSFADVAAQRKQEPLR
jgi:hypothetical protein